MDEHECIDPDTAGTVSSKPAGQPLGRAIRCIDAMFMLDTQLCLPRQIKPEKHPGRKSERDPWEDQHKEPDERPRKNPGKDPGRDQVKLPRLLHNSVPNTLMYMHRSSAVRGEQQTKEVGPKPSFSAPGRHCHKSQQSIEIPRAQ